MEENLSVEKHILLSVKPQFANMLVDGVKTIELRKKFPLDLAKDTTIFIYSSFPEKKVIGECKIKEVMRLPKTKLWNLSCDEAMISWSYFSEYFRDSDEGFAILVHKPLRYEIPVKLVELSSELTQAPQSFRYLHQTA